MSYTHAEFKTKVAQIVQDDAAKLTTTERDAFIQEAVKRYSKHRPREIVRDITGTATYDYAILTYLTSWIKGFSMIKSIEYPANDRDPTYVEDDDWIVYEKETGPYIRFLDDSPALTETIRVSYTALHILNDPAVTISIASPAVVTLVNHKLKPGDSVIFATTGALPTGITAGTTYYVISAGLTANAFEISATPGGGAINTSGSQSGAQTVIVNTISESDQDAVANLAASLYSEALASAYAQTSDSTITADAVDHKSKSQEYASRARTQKKLYHEHIGVKEGEVLPATARGDIEINYPDGTERLTHIKR